MLLAGTRDFATDLQPISTPMATRRRPRMWKVMKRESRQSTMQAARWKKGTIRKESLMALPLSLGQAVILLSSTTAMVKWRALALSTLTQGSANSEHTLMGSAMDLQCYTHHRATPRSECTRRGSSTATATFTSHTG